MILNNNFFVDKREYSIKKFMKHLIQIYELSLWSPSFGLGASHTFTHRGHTKPWLASQQTLRKALEVWVVGVVVAFRLFMFLL